ncbi:3856_t:CDS:2, partial [Ambispora leptoticha]
MRSLVQFSRVLSARNTTQLYGLGKGTPSLVIKQQVASYSAPKPPLSISKEGWVDPDPQFGDYPNPPWNYAQLRDPRLGWWDKQERRNFGDLVHKDFEAQDIFAPDIYPITLPFIFKGLAVATGVICAISFIATVTFDPTPDAIPRQFIRDGFPPKFDWSKRDSEGNFV